MTDKVSIGPISASCQDGLYRVEADVAGTPLWFESPDLPLAAAPEAFAGPLLLPALARRQGLHVTDPVCSTWHSHLSPLLDYFRRWWDYPHIMPEVEQQYDDTSSPATGVGLCFTGGVDSFYSLLHSPKRVDTLIYILDYDVPPQAPERYSRYEPHFRNLAAERRARAVLVRSNLRRHPCFAGPSWLRTHGGAIIAVGHLLRDAVGTLVISSSVSRFHDEPWGTHWEIDHLWSSARLQVAHFGEGLRRLDKVRRIVDHPLAHRYLRPCWENPENGLNCCVCEKCVRTQLAITICGDLDQFAVFKHPLSLLARLRQLRKIPRSALFASYADFVEANLPEEYHSALSALARRSRRSIFRKQLRQKLLDLWPQRLSLRRRGAA